MFFAIFLYDISLIQTFVGIGWSQIEKKNNAEQFHEEVDLQLHCGI